MKIRCSVAGSIQQDYSCRPFLAARRYYEEFFGSRDRVRIDLTALDEEARWAGTWRGEPPRMSIRAPEFVVEQYQQYQEGLVTDGERYSKIVVEEAGAPAPSAVIEAAPGLPLGRYVIGWASILVVERIRGPEVRVALPEGFDPLPGRGSEPAVIGGRLWETLWGCSYPADAMAAARAAHPGVTWTAGRRQSAGGIGVVPAIGVRAGRVVAVIASAPGGDARAALGRLR